MNLPLEKFCEKTYRLKNLVRYQTSPRIKDETVLEHLGMTAMIVPKLRDIYEFDLLKAIMIALYHDWGEQETSDVPFPIKRNMPPEIVRQLEDIEISVIKRDLSDTMAEWIKEFNSFEMCDASPEVLAVAYADAISVITYSKKEATLGNKEWFEGYVIPYTEKRIEKLKELLTPYLLISSS